MIHPSVFAEKLEFFFYKFHHRTKETSTKKEVARLNKVQEEREPCCEHTNNMRGTATDKLADVIQMLLFVQKTGILTVQRENPDKSVEEGALFLREGQVAGAMLGKARGADALKKLSAWTRCYFVFQALAPSASSPFSPQAPSSFDAGSEWQTRPLGTPVIPCRTEQYQYILPDFDRLGLSRLHRQFFLLADGQRSIDTLAKLLARHPQEVLALFGDMEILHLLRRL